MLGLLRTSTKGGKAVDGTSTPSSAPPSPTLGLRRNLSGSDVAAATVKAAFDRKKGVLGGQRKWVRSVALAGVLCVTTDEHVRCCALVL